MRAKKLHPNGVRELYPHDPRATVCGHCGRAWDESVSGTHGPRCAFEHEHEYPDDDPIDCYHAPGAPGARGREAMLEDALRSLVKACEPAYKCGRIHAFAFLKARNALQE